MKVRGIADRRRRDLLKVTGVAAALSVIPFTVPIAVAADSQKMKIGIIGSGHVGSALGGVWAKAGNEVMFSSRNLDNDKKLAAEVGANARAGTPQGRLRSGKCSCSRFRTALFPSSSRAWVIPTAAKS